MNYYIAYREHYYTNDGLVGLVQDPDFATCPVADQITYALSFESVESAQEWIESTESFIYGLNPNEAGRPEYKIINSGQAGGFSTWLEHADMGDNYYKWDHCADPEDPTDDERIVACNNLEQRVFDELNSIN